MNFKSIDETKTVEDQDYLYDLFESSFIFRPDEPLNEIVVEEYEEMRIDLVFQRMYNFEPYEVETYYENIDVLLFINNISNPLNIKKGMVLKFPNFDDFHKFRYKEPESSRSKGKPLLAVPNVSTKKDKFREQFKKNNFSLPPVALPEPRPAIRNDNGTIRIGGL